jgi:hypothetical protein
MNNSASLTQVQVPWMITCIIVASLSQLPHIELEKIIGIENALDKLRIFLEIIGQNAHVQNIDCQQKGWYK